LGVFELPLSPDHVMSMPSNRQPTPNTISCQVCHERRSLIPKSPGAGLPHPFCPGEIPPAESIAADPGIDTW